MQRLPKSGVRDVRVLLAMSSLRCLDIRDHRFMGSPRRFMKFTQANTITGIFRILSDELSENLNSLFGKRMAVAEGEGLGVLFPRFMGKPLAGVQLGEFDQRVGGASVQFGDFLINRDRLERKPLVGVGSGQLVILPESVWDVSVPNAEVSHRVQQR